MHSKQFGIDMLKDFVAKGVRNFAFIDEMIAPKHFEWLAKAIKEAKLDTAYYALSKAVRYFTPQILSLMAESGCKYMLWGLESGDQRVLDLMDKGTVVADVAMTLRRAHEAGPSRVLQGALSPSARGPGAAVSVAGRDAKWRVRRSMLPLA
jgi:radical SAM superfamily enzyme YgiQ (UPF0313 family)